MEKKSGLNISAKTFAGTVLILLLIIIFSGILTLVLPQGSFVRTADETGNTVIIPDTYAINTDAERLPIWRWFTAPFEIFAGSDALTTAVIIIFIILIGGTFAVLEKCGVFTYVINAVIVRYGAYKYRLLAAISLICMLLGSTMGLLEETVPLVPLIVSLAIALGWDTMTGLGMSILSVGFGFAAGTFNPFSIGIAQRLAEVPLFSGLAFRVVVFICVYALLVSFLIRYAKKIERDPSLSPTFADDRSRRNDCMPSETADILTDKKTKRAVTAFAAALALVFAYVICGLFVPSLTDYTMPVMAILITAGGITAGKISGYAAKGRVFKDFLAGTAAIAPSALLIIMAMSAKQILTAGGVMDTILYNVFGLLSGLSPYAAVLLLYLFVLTVQFFISSASAKAFLIMPLITPLSDMLGLTRQTAVTAFCFGDGFTNVFFPTNALLLIVLGLTGVSYGKWFKWTAKLQLAILALTALFLMAAVSLGYK